MVRRNFCPGLRSRVDSPETDRSSNKCSSHPHAGRAASQCHAARVRRGAARENVTWSRLRWGGGRVDTTGHTGRKGTIGSSSPWVCDKPPVPAGVAVEQYRRVAQPPLAFHFDAVSHHGTLGVVPSLVPKHFKAKLAALGWMVHVKPDGRPPRVAESVTGTCCRKPGESRKPDDFNK